MLATGTLHDEVVALEPLTLGHVDGLWDAASIERGTFGLTTVPASVDAMRRYVETALAEQARGASVPFATRDRRSGRVVGSTRFMNIERWSWPASAAAMQRGADEPDAVEIGATWLAERAQRTPINTHAKLLMLTYAFETWRVHRVTLKTDARNARSRAAIERLGGKLDGILRAHMPAADGGVRDSAAYSILSREWPAVRDRLAPRR